MNIANRIGMLYSLLLPAVGANVLVVFSVFLSLFSVTSRKYQIP